jgi:hypothetical protein
VSPSAIDQHDDQALAFTVNDPASGGPVQVLLQLDWLLTLERELTIFQRFRRHRAEEVDDSLVSAVDQALASLGAGSRYWGTREEYDLMVRCEGPAFRARGARKPTSLSFQVYSGDPPVPRALIQSGCRDERLPVDRRWEVAFWRENMAFGWRPQSPDGVRVRGAIDAGDQAALDELSSRDSIASVEITVITKGDAEWQAMIEQLTGTAPAKSRDEDLGEYVNRMDAWHKFRGTVGTMVTRYSLATPATRKELSLTFQCELWRVIGVRANGWMEEEGSVPGSWRSIAAHDGSSHLHSRMSTPGQNRTVRRLKI